MKTNPDRIDLAKEIPLDRPLSFSFESTTKCNFGCCFCPVAMDEERERVGFTSQNMPNEMFKKIVDDLKEFPRKVKVNHYHYMGEPLVNPNFYALVRYAVDANVAEEHWVRTNGSLLTKDNVRRLVDCGLTQIGISVEAVSEPGYVKVVKRTGMFDKVVNGVADLFEYSRGKCSVFAKIIDFGIPETNAEEFRRIFTPITDECGIEYPRQWNHEMPNTTLGNKITRTVNGDPLKKHVVCPYPFFTMAVNSKGKALMCCFDWSYQTDVGDVTKHSIKEIWNGPHVREFWKMMLRGDRRNNSACRDCMDIYTCPDNIDNERLELLERISKVVEQQPGEPVPTP